MRLRSRNQYYIGKSGRFLCYDIFEKVNVETDKTIKYNTNLPVNAIVRLPHPRNGDSQDKETLLAPSADKQTRKYDTECSNHHPSLPINPKAKGI